MPTNTYVALDTTTVVTATPSITFSNISQAYTDLVVVMTGTNATGGAGSVRFEFNGDTSAVYSNTRVLGDGSSASSTRNPNETSAIIGVYSDSTIGNNIISIMNYSNSTTYKTCLFRSNATDLRAQAGVALWRNTAAITSIKITNGAAVNFPVGNTFSLYGIKSWSDEVSPKATGGYVYEDSSYWYHAFPFSSTFTPSQTLTCDYLVVAGGAGAGYDRAGGGGAGGLRSTITATGGGGSLESAVSLNSGTAYTITVGAGGSPAVWTSTRSTGSNSSIAGSGLTTITSIGGGGGGLESGGTVAGTGGSGGGASFRGNLSGGAGTANQGYAGGNSQVATTAGTGAGGGGGGAGAAGQSSPALNVAGNGGNGVQITSITSATGFGINGYFAGGGGGGTGGTAGTGGLGGGGNGVTGSTSGQDGIVSTGGGGGGNNDITNGSRGGSGIVVIRYAK